MFNQIKGLAVLGIIASVEGNERTQARVNEGKTRISEARKGLATAAVKQVAKAKIINNPWKKELIRLGFEEV
jgi:hypothetical protein